MGLTSQSQRLRMAALGDALNSALSYGEEGLKLAVEILTNETGQMRLAAYDLLWEKLDLKFPPRELAARLR